MSDTPTPSNTFLRWTCATCGRVDIPIEDATLNLDDPTTAVLKAACPAGHETTRHLPADQCAAFIREVIREGVHITGSEVGPDALVLQVGSFDSWLNSPQFDAERAALRLTGGAA